MIEALIPYRGDAFPDDGFLDGGKKIAAVGAHQPGNVHGFALM